MYSCGYDSKIKVWSITDMNFKYELEHGGCVFDIVIGREGTPLANRLVSISQDRSCRVSNLETGAEVKVVTCDFPCWCIAVDKTGSVIAIGNGSNVTFIETENFNKVEEVVLCTTVNSLLFNKSNDCMLAVTQNGYMHSFKFESE